VRQPLFPRDSQPHAALLRAALPQHALLCARHLQPSVAPPRAALLGILPRARQSQPPVTPPCAPAVPGRVVPRFWHSRPTRHHLPPKPQSAQLASTCALISLVVWGSWNGNFRMKHYTRRGHGLFENAQTRPKSPFDGPLGSQKTRSPVNWGQFGRSHRTDRPVRVCKKIPHR